MSDPKRKAAGTAALLVLGAWLIAAPRAAAELQLTRLIGTGDPAPGLPAGYVVRLLRDFPQIDNHGNVAFELVIDRPTDPFFVLQFAFAYGSPADLDIVLRERTLAPGLPPPVEVFVPLSFALSPTGHFQYNGIVWERQDDDTLEGIIWSQQYQAGPSIVLRTSDPPPGVSDPGVVINEESIGPFLYPGAGGHAAFWAALEGPGIDTSNAYGLWLQSAPGGVFDLVARAGDHAAGMPPGVTYRSTDGLTSNYSLPNANGDMAFRAYLQGPGIDASNDAAIWTGTADNLSILARTGDPAPGAGDGAAFGSYGRITLNAAREHLFPSFLLGDGITPDNDFALYYGQAGGLQVLVREGEQATGMPAGIVFDRIQANDLNEEGLALGVGVVRGPGVGEANDIGIWMGEPGTFALILAETDRAAGTPEGVVFDLDITADVVLNNRGDVVIDAGLRGPSIDETNDRGIWARVAATGEWLKVVREGDMLDGRVVDSVNLHAPLPDLRPGRAFNDNGTLVINVGFTDSTAAIYTGLIPEPGSIVSICFGVSLLARRRRAVALES